MDFPTSKVLLITRSGWNNHKRAKGIQRSVVTWKIKHEDYLKIWNGEDDKTVEVHVFRLILTKSKQFDKENGHYVYGMIDMFGCLQ
jgi:hypothetical protein